MRISQYLLATLKETPANAEVISHQLMLRAGMIRQVTSGIYTWLPLGLRVLQKVMNIVREEMNKAGATEILMPSIQPAELWQESQRWDDYGDLMLKITDRNERAFCFGPTHEEVITDLARQEIHSYKQLPLNFYQIQTKFRDELRPRFGVMRAREFIMKDAYSFHLTEESLRQTYQIMHDAYCAIFTRLGLNFRPVLADTGSIGGDYSHEFQVLADSGEDWLVYSDGSDYAANLEKASALPSQTARQAPTAELKKMDTPGLKSIDALVKHFNLPVQKTVKTLLVAGDEQEIVALLLRGDHRLNPIKAEKLPGVASPLRWVDDATIKKIIGCSPGSIGPVNLSIPIIADSEVAILSDFICGANEDDQHWFNVNWERDLPLPMIADIRNVEEGDQSPDGSGLLRLTRGIEVGHIFQLGQKYSNPMQATVLNESGEKIPLFMGCYGIGVSRVIAAAIEQNHDAHGIIWSKSMAPFQIALIPLNYQKKSTVRELTEHLYQQLLQEGFEVLLDDRDERAGVKFADIDLIGIPHRLVLSERGLSQGTVEYKNRREAHSLDLPLKSIVDTLRQRFI